MKKHILLFFVVLGLAGCGSPGPVSPVSPGQSGTTAPPALVASRSIETLTPDSVLQTPLRSLESLGKVVDRSDGIGDDVLDGATLDSVWNHMKGFLARHVRYPIRTHKVTYRSRNASGQEQIVSGLVVVPYQPGGALKAPLLSLQHPTQVQRKYSPSNETLADNELTYQAACLFGVCGYIVVVADYPGLGVNADVHPYCHESLGNSVVDLIQVGQTHPDSAQVQTSWNGQLYLMGYSEGGYATLVAAKQLQARGVKLDGVATLDGPLSGSQAQRKVMLEADANYASPYFMPYVISAYASIYPEISELNYDQAVQASVPGYQPPAGSTYARQLRNLLDGSHSSEEISAFMKLATPYVGPRSILTPSFLTNLANNQSKVVQTLAANDGYRGWTPNFPLRMFHNRLDDLVPVENTREAAQSFGARSNITTEEYLTFIPGMASIHAGALPVAYVLGFNWIDTLAYPDRHL